MCVIRLGVRLFMRLGLLLVRGWTGDWGLGSDCEGEGEGEGGGNMEGLE